MNVKKFLLFFINIFVVNQSIKGLAIFPNGFQSNSKTMIFISYEESYDLASSSGDTIKSGLEFSYMKETSSSFPELLEYSNIFKTYCAAQVIRFYPTSYSEFIQILNVVSGHMVHRWRKWYPFILITLPSLVDSDDTLSKCISKIQEKTQINLTECIYQSIFVSKVLPTLENLKSLESHLNFYLELKIVLNNETSNYSSYWEVYFLNGMNSSRLHVQEIFRGQNVNVFDLEASRVSRRTNFHNVELMVVAPNFDDTKYHLTWIAVNGVNQLVGGISLEILRDLEYSLNFRSNIIEGDWITQSANGSLNGTTANLLKTRQVDLMIGHTVPIIKRAEIMDYLQSTSANTIRAFVNQPPASAINDIFTNPFQLLLLLSLGALALLVILSIHLISSILSNYGTFYNSADKKFKSESCMWLIACVTQQGWYTHPHSFPLRLVFITSAIAALVCYIAYAAKIVSVLSIESTPIKNLTGIFRSRLPLYAASDSVTIKELITGFQSEERYLKVLSVPLNLGVFLLFQSPSAFISYTHRYHEERKSKGISDYRACDIYAFPLTRSALPSAMGLPKRSPLREYFNYKIIAMKEKGLIDRYKKKTNIIYGLNCGSYTNRYRPYLGIMDVLTAVIVLCSGVTLCLGFLIIECIYFYKFSQIERKSNQLSWVQ